MTFDTHMHTELCGHAVGSPREYVSAAHTRGVDLIAFTCHVPMQNALFGERSTRMALGDLPRYRDMVADAREYGAQIGVEVLYGIEAEVFPDAAEMAAMDEVLASDTFDFVLGSLHHQLRSYQERIARKGWNSDARIIADYFEALTAAASRGRYDSFAHPDLIRIYGTVEPFHPSEYETLIREFLSAAAENGVCIEVNTSGYIKGVHEVHPHPVIMEWAAEIGTQFTMGSDSHRPEQVAQCFERAYAELHSAGIGSTCYFRNGRKVEISLEEQTARSGCPI
ncbi:MAG: histidinol-phosphatase HisJ family protein [Spirochaetaceae bacterium]|nr:MAG: histidinol-phosphatase HisJ family protein [Spirochaetaceae bacterium]